MNIEKVEIQTLLTGDLRLNMGPRLEYLFRRVRQTIWNGLIRYLFQRIG